jgi:hypothetical protein
MHDHHDLRTGVLAPSLAKRAPVADPRTATPAPLTPGPLAEYGHGLHIICALSDRRGYTTLNDTGKVVWAAFTNS